MHRPRLLGLPAMTIVAVTGCPLLSSAEQPFFEQFKYTVVQVHCLRPAAQTVDNLMQPVGTAFWVQTADGLVLVSNKHVFSKRTEILLSQYSGPTEPSATMIVALRDSTGKQLWVGHPDSLVDIAAIRVKYFKRVGDTRAKPLGISETLFASADELVEGDDVFVLGFPLGIRTIRKSYPVIMSGIISLRPTEDFLVLANGKVIGRNIYLIDANINSGNSGSPVFLKPLLARPFLQPGAFGAVVAPKLIGIVSAYVNTLMPVVQSDTGSYARANSGLVVVHRAEQIKDVVQLALQ